MARPGAHHPILQGGIMRSIQILFLLMFALVSEGAAQGDPESPGGSGGEDGCGIYLSCGTPQIDHYISPWAVGTKYERIHAAECKYCFLGGEEVEFTECHDQCFSVLGYREVEEAARANDIAALLRLVRVSPEFVSYNPSRHALQISSCSGTLTGNIPLGPAHIALAEAVLGRKALWRQKGSAFDLRRAQLLE
jgi:hypothetical protein